MTGPANRRVTEAAAARARSLGRWRCAANISLDKKIVNFRAAVRELGQRGFHIMKKAGIVVAIILFASGTVFAETSNPVATPRQRLEAPDSFRRASDQAGHDSVRRVKGVFRVFGDDDEVSTGPRANTPRRKSRRSSKARRSSETQRTRGNRTAQPEPDGILILLDGVPVLP